MESKDVPQWVAQSFLRAMVNAGASATREEIISCCNELISQWRAPGRSEHGFQHLLDMLSRVDTLAPETPNADLVRLATWFHGIVFSTADLDVYTRNGGEDERASALMAEAKLSELGLPTEKIKTVKKLIIGLKSAERNVATQHL
ncbi:HD domain-containing protein [Arcanobacterium hippocoleae]|uniref:HD domain-containing protein n=1 Tax=Arcanobacterium hippocoleae TaxID=149017 RepID=UPI0033415C4D